jgi:SNF2 family DNA or RNA helicase
MDAITLLEKDHRRLEALLNRVHETSERATQTRLVFAYRLLAADTVVEKIVELQQTKRELADAIVRADTGLLRNLKAEDLEVLLS